MTNLDDELAHLAELSLDDLQANWIARMGGPAPQVSVELLRMLLAYHVQEVVFGGCHDTAGRIVEGQVADAPERSDRVGQGSSNATPISAASTGPMRRTSTAPRRPAEAITLPVGTRLVREWNGQTIRVEVTEAGYAWNGELHPSLSAVARAVSGARWSGPRFFGIAGKGAHG